MGTTYLSLLSKIEPGGTKNGGHVHGHWQPVPGLEPGQAENVRQYSLLLCYPTKTYCLADLKSFIEFSVF